LKLVNGRGHRSQASSDENKKGYVYGQHYSPHDIEVRELGTGVSRKETAAKLGVQFQTVQRPAKKEDGIDAIRSLLPRCYFDEIMCKRGIDGLKGYKKKWNDKLMVYYNEPVHDWTSHPTDAFQTLALSNPEQVEVGPYGRLDPGTYESVVSDDQSCLGVDRRPCFTKSCNRGNSSCTPPRRSSGAVSRFASVNSSALAPRSSGAVSISSGSG
jgi:hypothetical protein